jgi:hypothetical protein
MIQRPVSRIIGVASRRVRVATFASLTMGREARQPLTDTLDGSTGIKAVLSEYPLQILHPHHESLNLSPRQWFPIVLPGFPVAIILQHQPGSSR